MYLIEKEQVGYLEFSPEDGKIYNEVKDCFNAQELGEERVKFDTFDPNKATSNPIVAAFTNSDSLIPDLLVYRKADFLKKDLKSMLKDYLKDYDKVDYFASDDEIDKFVDTLNGIASSISLVQNDFEIVCTAFMLGSKNE